MSVKLTAKHYLWLFIIGFTLATQILMAGYTMDDAFISFRYARNVAQGHGWVYNVGGPAVEGFSNFLWILLLVPCFWLRIDPMLFSQGLGIVCSLVILALTARIAESGVENPRSPMQLAAPLMLALTGSFTYQAVTGLETHLFTLGLMLGVFFFLRGDNRSLLYSAGGFVIASLTRPEGPALFGLTFLFLFLRCIRRSTEWNRLVRLTLAYAIPYSLFLAWRYHTFDQLVPNTYFAKVGAPGSLIPEGAKYVFKFFQTHGTALPWVVALLPLIWRRRRPRELYLFSLCIAFLAVVIYEGGDWMPLHRMLAPILPVLFILVAQGFDHLRQGWGILTRQSTLSLNTQVVRWLTGLWLVMIAAVLFYPSIAIIKEARIRPGLYEQSHVAMGRWLKEQCQPHDRIALSDIGQIGYFSNLWVIDLAGLTDPTIAHSPGGLHKKQYDPLYVLDQQPRYVVLVSAKVGGKYVIRGFETDKRLYNHPRFKKEYRLLPRESLRFKYKDNYTYWIFERVVK